MSVMGVGGDAIYDINTWRRRPELNTAHKMLLLGSRNTISNHPTLTDNIISYWRLDEASGVRFDSVIASGNNLTDNNTVLSAPGIVGNAALFVGANDEYLSIADASQSGLDITGAMTAVCWVNVPSFSGERLPFGKFDTGGNQRSWVFSLNTDTIHFIVSPSGGSGVTTITATTFGTLSVDTWYFFVARYDGINLKLRVNSTDQTPVAYSSGIFDSTAPLLIGGTFVGGSLFGAITGKEDGCAVWSRSITDSEVTYLFNNGLGRAFN